MSTQIERVAHQMRRNEGILMVATDMERAKQTAMWGTYGKLRSEPLRYVRLIDCATDHLQAILRTQPQVKGDDYETIILSILADRGVK